MNGLRKHIKGSQAQKDKHCTFSLICGTSFEVLIYMLNLRVEATQLQRGHNGEQPEQCVWGGVHWEWEGLRRDGVKKRRGVCGRRVYENEGCKKYGNLLFYKPIDNYICKKEVIERRCPARLDSGASRSCGLLNKNSSASSGILPA